MQLNQINTDIMRQAHIQAPQPAYNLQLKQEKSVSFKKLKHIIQYKMAQIIKPKQ